MTKIDVNAHLLLEYYNYFVQYIEEGEECINHFIAFFVVRYSLDKFS